MRSAETGPFRVVSGGQTGVDRGALDAALELGVPCGGWCPAGRLAEDGVIPARYPVTELHGAGYDERTHKNVEDSDGTLIITFGHASGGTARTIEVCGKLGRPHLIVDAASVTVEEGVRQAVRFVREEGVGQLNVAGPRASGEPRGYEYTRALVRELCRQCIARQGIHSYRQGEHS
ncbi:MAG TPA: putative molybdenum carrier protein [Steroidobacteraceae bacterium]